MKKIENAWQWAFMLSVGAACGIALAVSLASYRVARDRSSGAPEVAALRGELDALDAQVLALRKRMDGMRNVADMMARGRDNGFSPSRPMPPRQPGEPGGTGGDGEFPAGIEPAIGTGSVGVAAGVDPAMLQDMQQEYTRRKAAAEYHKAVRLRYNAQLAEDAKRVDATRMNALYDLARKSSTDGDVALNTLLTEYPEANATGMALAERALEAALSSDTASVEQYYQALIGSGNFNDVVTDMGVEAVPTVQGYLINQYLAEGRFDDAEALIQNMTTQFGESYVADVGQGGEPKWVPVSELVDGVSTVIDQLRGGDTSALNTAPGGGAAPGGASSGGVSPGGGSPGGGSMPRTPGTGGPGGR